MGFAWQYEQKLCAIIGGNNIYVTKAIVDREKQIWYAIIRKGATDNERKMAVYVLLGLDTLVL